MELTKSAVSSFVSEYTRNICKCKISEEIKLYIFLYDITVQPYYSTHAILVEKWGILLRLAGMNKLLQKKYFSEYHRKIQEKVSKKYKILYNMIQESAGWNIRPAKERRENGKIQFKK